MQYVKSLFMHIVPVKTLLFISFSTVAAMVAIKSGLLDNSDFPRAWQSNHHFVEDYKSYLARNHEHPWCGYQKLHEYEVRVLVADGSGDNPHSPVEN